MTFHLTRWPIEQKIARCQLISHVTLCSGIARFCLHKFVDLHILHIHSELGWLQFLLGRPYIIGKNLQKLVNFYFDKILKSRSKWQINNRNLWKKSLFKSRPWTLIFIFRQSLDIPKKCHKKICNICIQAWYFSRSCHCYQYHLSEKNRQIRT